MTLRDSILSTRCLCVFSMIFRTNIDDNFLSNFERLVFTRKTQSFVLCDVKEVLQIIIRLITWSNTIAVLCNNNWVQLYWYTIFQKDGNSRIVNRNPTYNFKFLQCYIIPADFLVDCIAIPLLIKSSAFPIGSQISCIASDFLVGFLNPASKDTMAPLHVLSNLQLINWLAIWR